MFGRRLAPGSSVLGCLVLFGVAGCGAPGPSARGTVTVNGEALSDGSVSFEALDGASASVGAKVTDGGFVVPESAGMRPGPKRVTIRGSIKTGRLVQAAPPAPPGVLVDDLKYLPPHGGRPEVREVEVRDGDNEFRFEIRSGRADDKR
ncbi:hypothetical protein [Gemmata sp.]|uniref:hypothetical protein n=1 Tax=Gemmata sp. TaxID=1914242 RepID=UPI003F7036E2